MNIIERERNLKYGWKRDVGGLEGKTKKKHEKIDDKIKRTTWNNCVRLGLALV